MEVVLRIFITLKNPSLSKEFETAKLWSNSKHDKHYITENDYSKREIGGTMNIFINCIIKKIFKGDAVVGPLCRYLVTR
jgi:hypothetical protein